MIIQDECDKTIIIDSLNVPILSECFWVLDLNLMDYKLTPLIMLEEIISPTITLRIQGFEFKMPSTWFVLVFSEETQQLDVADGEQLTRSDFSALVYGSNRVRAVAGRIVVVDFEMENINFAPALGKHQMLCHPVGPDVWVNIAPVDVYNKYLRQAYAGDII